MESDTKNEMGKGKGKKTTMTRKRKTVVDSMHKSKKEKGKVTDNQSKEIAIEEGDIQEVTGSETAAISETEMKAVELGIGSTEQLAAMEMDTEQEILDIEHQLTKKLECIPKISLKSGGTQAPAATADIGTSTAMPPHTKTVETPKGKLTAVATSKDTLEGMGAEAVITPDSTSLNSQESTGTAEAGVLGKMILKDGHDPSPIAPPPHEHATQLADVDLLNFPYVQGDETLG